MSALTDTAQRYVPGLAKRDAGIGTAQSVGVPGDPHDAGHVVSTGTQTPPATARRSRSALVTELLRLMRDPAAGVAQLGAVVSGDRALSERVLRIANSPLLGIPSRVETVPHAVTMLGFEALRETVMRMVVTSAFRKIVILFTQYEEFWKHSVACGLAARVIGRRHPSVRADEAFVAGLFHDIGTIAPVEERDSQPVAEALPAGGSQASLDEHAETGALLAEQWGMGGGIVEAIRVHHRPADAVDDPCLAATVHVADVLCRRMGIGSCGADPDRSCDPTALRVLGLTEADLSPEGLQEDIQHIQAGLMDAPSFDHVVATLKQALVNGVSSLPYQERLALALYYEEGLATSEVAHLMGVTEETVQRLHEGALSALATIIHDCA